MRYAWFLVLLIVLGCGPKRDGSLPGERGDHVQLEAADGASVDGELVSATTQLKGVILMFHQAGSNLHEYDPIAPYLAQKGWDCLKVDQRAGGKMWGHENATARLFEGKANFEDAYQDLEAALNWAVERKYERIVAWGSSYSASLVLRLAAENETVDAVVSFSPGEYFDEKGIVADWNAKVKVPCFIAATSEELIGGVYGIVDTKPDVSARELDVVFGTKDGVHGSSALREDRNPKDRDQYWEKLETFLDSFVSGGKNFGG